MMNIKSNSSQKWLSVVFFGLLCPVICPPALSAQESVITVDPATTQIQFTLGATMHTVHGNFKLKSGQLHLDSATGHVSGSVVVDATSANTDNASRDKNMHKQVLESAKFPEIVFTPTHVKGAIPKEGSSQVEVSGVIRIHGAEHPVTLTFSVQPGAAGSLQASARFPVPYKSWGLKDPSTFLLHVSDTVNVEVRATARIAPAHE